MAIIELELKVPQKLEAIKLRQYQEYLKIQKDNKDTEDNGNFLNSKCIQIFCGLTLKESYNLPVKMFDGVLNQIGTCFEEKTPLIKEFSMTGSNDVEVSFGMIPSLDEMTFGEYVDLENFISDWDTMHKAMAVLYRPIKYNNNGKYLIEDYDGSDRYWEVMKDAPVNVSLGAMVFFLSFREKIMQIYDGLFTPSAKAESNFNIGEGFGKKWGWYQSIYALAGKDVSRISEVTKISLHQCLIWLEFEKEKNDLEQKMIKNAYNKNR